MSSSVPLIITNTENAVSSITGCLRANGGISCSKDLVVLGFASHMENINMNDNKIVELKTPTDPGDAVNKLYVDAVSSGLTIKTPVLTYTTSPGDLSTDYENGDYIGLIQLSTGDRILIKNQTLQTENGIYTVNVSGSPTRATDFDSGQHVGGSVVYVNDDGTSWQCSNVSPNDVVGVNNILFAQFSSPIQLEAGSGLTKTVNTLSVNVDSTSIEVFNDILRVSSSICSTGLTGGSGLLLSTTADQSHVTKVGTLINGTWNANTISVLYGGTGNTTFTSGQILFGNSTNAISTDSTLFWNNTKKSLGINTNSPDPSTEGDGITLLDKDISFKCSDNSTGLNGLLFQNSNNNYTWRIHRKDAGSNNADLLFSGGTPGLKTSLTNNLFVMRYNGNVGINPTNISDISEKLYVNGNISCTGSITGSSISGGISSPTITTSNTVNCTVSSIPTKKLLMNSSEAFLTVSFIISPTLGSTNTQFQFDLPSLSTVLANRYDIVCNVSGWTDDTNLYVLNNILGCGVSSTTRCLIKFESMNTNNHFIQAMIRYNV